MAHSKSSAAPKKRAKRPSIKVYVTAEQKSQLQRAVPDKELGQYCRDRIFQPWGLRDPLIEVGSRLLGRAAQAKRLGEVLNKLEARADEALSIAISSGAETDAEEYLEGLLARMQHTKLLDAIGEVREILGPFAEDAREVRRLIAGRREQSFPVPIVSKRETD